MGIYASNGRRYGTWCNFFNVETLKRNKDLQGFHNQHYTMFQCFQSYKIWVFKNMQTKLWTILWPVYHIIVRHTHIWAVYDIHPTLNHHIWLRIYFLIFVWSTRVIHCVFFQEILFDWRRCDYCDIYSINYSSIYGSELRGKHQI